MNGQLTVDNGKLTIACLFCHSERSEESTTYQKIEPNGRPQGSPLREPRNDTKNLSLPLPVGEVAECGEDGEGNKAQGILSVTFGDSSPKGGAKETTNGTPKILRAAPQNDRSLGSTSSRKQKTAAKNRPVSDGAVICYLPL